MSTAAPTTSSPGTTTSSSGASTTTAAPTAGATTTIPVGLRTHATPIGSVLATASGYTVYELVGATASQSPCRGACLSVWPAVTVNGKQVVVDGHPGYTFVGDTAPGQAKGQGLRDTWGLWLALDPAGQPITGKAASSTTTTSSGYGSP
jgi:predicted lipoprotein with Yx(FWY)xxD motif